MTACLHTPGLILGLLADLGDTPAAVAATQQCPYLICPEVRR